MCNYFGMDNITPPLIEMTKRFLMWAISLIHSVNVDGFVWLEICWKQFRCDQKWSSKLNAASTQNDHFSSETVIFYLMFSIKSTSRLENGKVRSNQMSMNEHSTKQFHHLGRSRFLCCFGFFLRFQTEEMPRCAFSGLSLSLSFNVNFLHNMWFWQNNHFVLISKQKITAQNN